MKKYFVILILPLFLLVSCRANSIKLYEHGNFEEAIQEVDSLEHPTSEDYLAKILSLKELNSEEDNSDELLMYLLSSNDSSASEYRKIAVNEFLQKDFSNELCVLCLKPEDGLEAQIKLYKAYSTIKDLKNSRILLDSFLSKELGYLELTKLLIDYPSDTTYTLGVFESWFENLDNSDKQKFSELLYNFVNSENLSEKIARTIIYICQQNEEDKFFTSSSQGLSQVYRTHAKALEIIGDNKTAKSFYDKINQITRKEIREINESTNK